MQNAPVSNPNDFKVVSFHNATEFGFTPEMGCMYDGRAINGAKGSPGIDAGETVVLPYHIAHQLATNLAKRVLNISPAATVDAKGIPTGVPIWSAERLDEEKKKFLTDLYAEEKPVAQSQTDLLMQKVDEYRKVAEELLAKNDQVLAEQPNVPNTVTAPTTFVDKQEVIAELEKRGIAHDKRKTKADLEKLLV